MGAGSGLTCTLGSAGCPHLVQAAALQRAVLCRQREQVLSPAYGFICWQQGPFIRGAAIQLTEPGQTR